MSQKKTIRQNGVAERVKKRRVRRQPMDTSGGHSGSSGEKRAGDYLDEQGPRPPPPPGGSGEAFRMNVQLQAEVEGLREEMLRYKRALQIHQEVNRIGVQNTDQRKEIINHFHQVVNPDPIPVIQQEDHTKLIETLENAIKNQNHAFLHSAHEMGLTMKEIIEMMKQKGKERVEKMFSWEKVSKDIETIFLELLSK